MEILNQADIGVFGGSGFYNFLKDIEEVKIYTPYGETSDSVFIGSIGYIKRLLCRVTVGTTPFLPIR